MVERKVRKKSTEEIAENITEVIKKPAKVSAPGKLISSGCTMLNLALSDTPDGGYRLGTVVHIIGDTHAGKSLLALNMMAEASIDKKLGDYALVYEEPESAMFFPVKKMFGEDAEKRLKFIPTMIERKKGARTVQKWHDDLLAHAVPFVWVTDSFDALTSEEDLSTITADGKKKKLGKGGFRVEKPIVAKQLFPKMVGRIEASQSIFMWISQTIKNIGVTFGPSETFAGGSAITFFRAYEIWLAVVERIYIKVRGKDREVGAWVRARIKKNKFTAKVKEVTFPVYPYPYGYGIDDVGAMVGWMVEEGYWEEENKDKKKGKKKNIGKILTEEPFIDGKPEVVIRHIEENNLEGRLKEIVTECWLELEKEISTTRKPRY